jgi:RimJ/RimL family protein N-acetyltransferase
MIYGKYIGLRAIEKEDLPMLLHWRNSPWFRQYFREYRELSAMNQELWFENIVQKDRNTVMFSIVDKKTGDLLGACGLCYIDWINRNEDFSLYIGTSDAYIDKKFAPDAGKSLLKYGFNELNLHRVYAEVFDFDKPKQALMKQLGFQLEGTNRQTHWSYGKWNDSFLYGILKDDNSIRMD